MIDLSDELLPFILSSKLCILCRVGC